MIDPLVATAVYSATHPAAHQMENDPADEWVLKASASQTSLAKIQGFHSSVCPCTRLCPSTRPLIPAGSGGCGRPLFFFYCFSKAENLGGKHTGGEFNEGKKRFLSSKFSI